MFLVLDLHLVLRLRRLLVLVSFKQGRDGDLVLGTSGVWDEFIDELLMLHVNFALNLSLHLWGDEKLTHLLIMIYLHPFDLSLVWINDVRGRLLLRSRFHRTMFFFFYFLGWWLFHDSIYFSSICSSRSRACSLNLDDFILIFWKFILIGFFLENTAVKKFCCHIKILIINSFTQSELCMCCSQSDYSLKSSHSYGHWDFGRIVVEGFRP